jgi:CPA1 family monovalent cation:H+ antiporter
LAFTGVRGIVSLAAALAIPVRTVSGVPFPHRDLILFVTFFVILVTLVGQGLLLPSAVRMLGLVGAGRREHHADRVAEFKARRRAVEAAIERLEQLSTERQLADDFTRPLRERERDRLARIERRGWGEDGSQEVVESYDQIEFLLIAAERNQINVLYRGGELKDEARRRIERDLDLREANLANLRAED